MAIVPFFSMDYFEKKIKENESTHVIYQVDVNMDTDDWGTEDYVCYVCSEDFHVSLTGCYDDRPMILNSRVCSCSHDDNYNPSPSSSSDSNNATTTTTKQQFSVISPFNSSKHYLFLSNSMFSGYLIHTACCSMYVSPPKMDLPPML